MRANISIKKVTSTWVGRMDTLTMNDKSLDVLAYNFLMAAKRRGAESIKLKIDGRVYGKDATKRLLEGSDALANLNLDISVADLIVDK